MSLQVRLQALLMGVAALLAALVPLVGLPSGTSPALPLNLVGALASAGVVILVAVALAGFYPHHPTPGFWYGALALQVLAATALVWFTGGVDSPALLLLFLLSAVAGIQHSHWAGVATGMMSGMLVLLVFLAGKGAHLGLLGAILPIVALPAFGCFGFLSALAGSGLDDGYLAEQSRKLEDAYSTARQQAQERERREHELADKQRKLAALMQVSRHLSTVRSPEELLAMIVRSAREEMNSGITLLLLIQGNELTVAHHHGISTPTAQALRTRVGTGLFGRLVVSGESCRFSAKDDGFAWHDGLPGVRERFRTLLAVPLKSPQDRLPFGLLAVANILVGDRYDEDHEDYLELLATDAAISIKNISLFNELERSYYEIIQALAQAIEAKDPYTHGHVARVRTHATRLARALNLPPDEVELIAKAAILHDVGKISIPDGILMKAGALTAEEFEVMKSHAENALHILKDIRSLPPRIIDMVLHHHERYDGKGYPHGLKGEEIPLGAQIIALADTYDAMTSDRPYRKGFTPEEALARMEAAMETQFNPRLLKAFFSLFDYKPRKQLPLEVRPGAPTEQGGGISR